MHDTPRSKTPTARHQPAAVQGKPFSPAAVQGKPFSPLRDALMHTLPHTGVLALKAIEEERLDI